MRSFVLLLAAALLAAGCVSSEEPPVPSTNATATTPPTAAATTMTATIEVGESPPAPGAPALTPGGMYLRATGMDALVVGVPVVVNITNKGEIVHDVLIDGTDFNSKDIEPGKSVTVTWTPTKAGEYTMYCSKGFPDPAGTGAGSHRGAGMQGKAVVKDA